MADTPAKAIPPTPATPESGRMGDTRTSEPGGQARNTITNAEAARRFDAFMEKYNKIRSAEAVAMATAGTSRLWDVIGKGTNFACRDKLYSLGSNPNNGIKNRPWVCHINEQLRYHESKYSTASTEIRVFVEGAEVTPYLEGQVAWSIQTTGGQNNASFTLNNSEDAFIITPENVCSGIDPKGWRISKDITKQLVSGKATVKSNRDESAKYLIYRQKWNTIFRSPDPKKHEIDDTGMWLYPLTPNSCIFNKHDCVRIFVRLSHVTGASGLDENKKKDWVDLWAPAFCGFIDTYDFESDAVTGKRAVHIRCYDYKGLLDRMRVRMEGNPTGSTGKAGEINEGDPIASILNKGVTCQYGANKPSLATQEARKNYYTVSGNTVIIKRAQYLQLLREYSIGETYTSGTDAIMKAFTESFDALALTMMQKTGSVGQTNASKIIAIVGKSMVDLVRDLVCSFLQFDIAKYNIEAATAVKFKVKMVGELFVYEEDLAAAQTDWKLVDQLFKDLTADGFIKAFVADTVLSLPSAQPNNRPRYNAVIANMDSLYKKYAAKFKNFNISLPPIQDGKYLNSKNEETYPFVRKKFSGLATSTMNATDRAEYSGFASCQRLETFYWRQYGGAISSYLNWYIVTGKFSPQIVQQTGLNAMVNTPANQTWEVHLREGTAQTILNTLLPVLDKTRTTMNAELTSTGGNSIVGKAKIQMKAAVDKINKTIQNAAITRKRSIWTKLSADIIKANAVNQSDAKLTQKIAKERDASLAAKVNQTKEDNLNNNNFRGRSQTVVAPTGDDKGWQSAAVDEKSRATMSKADLLSVDASFPDRMAKMYSDLVSTVQTSPHPLAGKSFEAAVEWLSLTNIPTWRGFQFFVGKYGDNQLQDWNKIAVFGPLGRPFTYQEVTEIGRGTVTDIDTKAAFSPVQPFIHMLLPEKGTGAMTIVANHTTNNAAAQSAFKYATRLSLLNEICQVLDYQFYCSPYGDLIYEYPHYNALPTDFGTIFRGAYTVAAELRSCQLASEVGEMNTAWVLEGYEDDISKENVSGTANVTNLFKKYVIIAPMLARRVGAKVRYIKLSIPGVGGALNEAPTNNKDQPNLSSLIAYAYLDIQRELGYSETMSIEHNYRPYLVPNRPIWLVHYQRIGLTKVVNYSVDVYKGAGTAKAELGYIKSMYRDGTYRTVAGGWRSPVNYAGIMSGYMPDIKFGASKTPPSTNEDATDFGTLNKYYKQEYGWATKGNMENGVFCLKNASLSGGDQAGASAGPQSRYSASRAASFQSTNNATGIGDTNGTGFHQIGGPRGTAVARYEDTTSKAVRDYYEKPKKTPMSGPRKGATIPWNKLSVITIHQTGSFNPKMQEADWRKTNAHFVVRANGIWYQLVENINTVVWTAHGLSPNAVNIEIEGKYAGLVRNPYSKKGNSYPENTNVVPSTVQINAVKQVMRLINNTIKANSGAGIKAIYAHRQSASLRESDPGELIWKTIVLPMQVEFGISEGARFLNNVVTGDGKPIPTEWDPRSPVAFWSKQKIS